MHRILATGVVAAALAQGLPAPAHADSYLSFGPWAAAVNRVEYFGFNAINRLAPPSAVPRTGSATYMGSIAGTANLTPSTTNQTAHDLLGGSITINADFARQSLSGGVRLAVIDPRTGSQLPIGAGEMPLMGSYTASAHPTYRFDFSTYSAYYPLGGAGTGKFINNAHATVGTFSGNGRIPQYPIQFSYTDITLKGAFLATKH